MKISLNEIKKLVKIPENVSNDELVRLIGSRLVEVEGTEDWSEKYAGIYIVKVLSAEPIPDTHLHLCMIDAGAQGHVKQSSSQDSGSPEGVQVVCGAPNVRAGMWAVWIAPGAVVPATYGTAEPFQISARKLRGHLSNGMLAAADELALGTDHDGIIELDPAMLGADCQKLSAGASFAEVFGLNDVILDIENKSLTHRPDTFGLIGFAREVAGILGQKFIEPAVFANATAGDVAGGASESGQAPVAITIVDPDLCPRYSCAVLDYQPAEQQYFGLQDAFLAKAGMRAISPIVDLTNVLMLMTGQPLHAFDYDKFVKVGQAAGAKSPDTTDTKASSAHLADSSRANSEPTTPTPQILVRAARAGEELQLLDGKTIKCTENDILITSNDVPVALAGAMGGTNTEIDASTRRIILESASFSLYHLRKTQMAHGIFSEAITRFTKGQPAGQTMPVLRQAVRQLDAQAEYADCYPAQAENPVISLTTAEVNNLLGTDYDADLMVRTLQNVGFAVEASAGQSASAAPARSSSKNPAAITVKAPFWRTDIHIKEDVIEEIGRLNGYDNIPLDFPLRPFTGAQVDPLLTLKSKIRNLLSLGQDAHELLTYSFVSEKLQQTVRETPADSYQIVNSISPELQCFRQSIIPSLLEKLQLNQKAGYASPVLYEMNQVASRVDGLNSENVPQMHTHLALVLPGDYYAAKARLVALCQELGVKADMMEFDDGGAPYFEPLHAAKVQTMKISDAGYDTLQAGKNMLTETSIAIITLGYLGEIRPAICKALKLDSPVAAFELDLEQLLTILPKNSAKSLNLSKFPSVSRDITAKVAADLPYQALETAVEHVLAKSALVYQIEPKSVYMASEGPTAQNGNSARAAKAPARAPATPDQATSTPDKAPATPATKNISFHLSFASREKTLESAEISAIMEEITKRIEQEFSAEII